MIAAEALDHFACAGANAAMMIYKVLRPAEWADFQARGSTSGAPVDLVDGFVHFSTAAQLSATVSRHFACEQDLVLLACDTEKFGEALRWEPSRGGALFPHVYRALRLDDIEWSRAVERLPQGHDLGPME